VDASLADTNGLHKERMMPSSRTQQILVVVALVVVGGLLALKFFGGSAGSSCGLSTAAIIALEEELSHGHSGEYLVANGLATSVCVEVAEKELPESRGLSSDLSE
jgi:hypothetical protein